MPGIDAVYIGPADLSITYGLPPGLDNPADEFESALETVVAACERHGVVPGIHSTPPLAGHPPAGRLPHDHGLVRRGVAMAGMRAD